MPRILVVDDSPSAVQHLVKAARPCGLEVVPAQSAEEAIRKIADEVFAVVVTDLRMETSEAGLEVLKAAKDRDTFTQVILISAYSAPQLSVQSMSLGAFDYLEKGSPGIDVFEMLTKKVRLALDYRNAKLRERGHDEKP
jgi:DNA-binding NtrC family response regulator